LRIGPLFSRQDIVVKKCGCHSLHGHCIIAFRNVSASPDIRSNDSRVQSDHSQPFKSGGIRSALELLSANKRFSSSPLYSEMARLLKLAQILQSSGSLR
jgi:hypothetical protein